MTDSIDPDDDAEAGEEHRRAQAREMMLDLGMLELPDGTFVRYPRPNK